MLSVAPWLPACLGYSMTKKRAGTASAFTPPTGHRAFDDWVAPQRTAAIARIIKSVGKHPGKHPSDEVRLAADIYQAYIEAPLEIDPDDSSKAKNRLNSVKAILKGVENQCARIAADPYLSSTINKANGVQPAPITSVLFQLRSLEIALSSRAQKWRSKANLPPELKGRRPTELEWLAGVSLPLIYERHFLSRAGRSRNTDGKPDGPSVRFTGATLEELDMSYSRESIARAFTRMAPFRKTEIGRISRRANCKPK